MTQGDSSSDAKRRILREMSALHPHPDAVHDPLFAHSDFFDPRDLVQVRYEMVRRVQRDRESVAVVMGAFGVSRSTFWRAHAAFTRAGLPGLVPQRRGPRHPSKLGGWLGARAPADHVFRLHLCDLVDDHVLAAQLAQTPSTQSRHSSFRSASPPWYLALSQRARVLID